MGSRNLWSPQVVSTQPQQYVVVPAASNGPLVAYGNPQDLSQFAQPVMPFQQVSGNQVAALGFLGRQAPVPVVAEEDTDPVSCKNCSSSSSSCCALARAHSWCIMGLTRFRMSTASPRTSSPSSLASCLAHLSSGRCPRLRHRSLAPVSWGLASCRAPLPHRCLPP